MKKLIGLALLLMFIAGVLFLAPASSVRASNLAMPQNDSMQGKHGRRHGHRNTRRHHRWHRRHHHMHRHDNKTGNMNK